MALDYRKCAEEIYSHLGGKENIVSAAHCATRLRLVIADNSKIDKAALENVEGVKGMFESNGQLQLIIGTGTVNKVYDEFLAITGLTAATKAEVKAAAAAQAPLWRRILKVPGDVFVPILPAIVAAGLMMGLVEALGKAIPGFASSDWYGFLDMASSTAFSYLPVLVAISSAIVFGGNTFLGAVIGLMMVNSSLLNAWNTSSASAINSFFGVTDGVIPTWRLFFFNVQRVGYQGHVIPVILAVFLMCQIEKWLHKHVPEMIDLFVTPLCTVMVTAFITFTIIGPIFSVLENWVLAGAQVLITVGYGIGAAIMGAIYPLTVVMGLHHMYNIIESGMLSSAEFNNLNIWMPIASAANFAQFGACLAVFFKTRNNKTKSVALPSALSASLGITEPAIFGVNFRFMKPFVAGMIGGAVGAWYGSISGIGATTYGVTGIPGLLAIDHIPQYCLLLLISAGIAFVLTMVIWGDPQPEGAAAQTAASAQSGSASQAAPAVPLKKSLYAPVKGNVIPASQIPDQTFASLVLGDGVGIEPEEGVVYAPYDGVISSVTETHHAVSITGPDDMEVLIHVGVDTVKMEGDGFTCHVTEGQSVKKGQKLITFDRNKIKKAGFSDTVAVLLTNSDDFPNFKVLKTGASQVGDELYTIE